MRKNLVKHLRIGTLALGIGIAPTTATASDYSADSGAAMLWDLVILRPVGLAATVVGAAAFVVALPFTVPSGSVNESAHALVGEPAAYTFKRPLGEFYTCEPDRYHVCDPQ